jgi:hypothetical protein
VFIGGTCPSPSSFAIGGALGGVQAGYNWQVNRWLTGLESDLDWSAIKGGAVSNFQIGQAPANFVANENVYSAGTAGLGWAGCLSTIFYSTEPADCRTAGSALLSIVRLMSLRPARNFRLFVRAGRTALWAIPRRSF